LKAWLTLRAISSAPCPAIFCPECCQLLGLIAQTLSIALAVAVTEDGERLCMLETDAQGTISNWGIRRANPDPAVERIADPVPA
jgi:hypothetical protein